MFVLVQPYSYSVTLMLAELNLQCFQNLMSVDKINFLQRWSQCTNRLVFNMYCMKLYYAV